MAPLYEQTKAINNGKMVDAEAMLISQSSALQTIFTELVRRSALNMGQHKAAETYMRLALKAQAQCTRTLEVLAAIKNPPLVIAKQANIANGPQQVNNGEFSKTPHDAHAGKIQNEQSKLILGQSNEAMDTRGAAAAIGANQELETVGAINRPENARG